MRNIHLALMAMLCFTSTSFVSASDQFTVDPGDPSVLYPVFTGVDDTANIQATVNYAMTRAGAWQGTWQNSCTVRLPWKGRPWIVTDTIQVNGSGSGMPNLSQVDITIVGDAKANLIDYRKPPNGTIRGNRAVFRTWGIKRSRFENVSIRVSGDSMSQSHNASNIVGFMIDSRADAFSTSWNTFKKCRVEFAEYTITGTGFLIGAETTGAPGADFSVNKFDHCEVSGLASIGSNLTPKQRTQASVAAGHTGFALVGSNNLAETFNDCSVNGMAVGFKAYAHTLRVGDKSVTYPAGGSGSFFRNCGGSFVGLGFWIDGGFQAHVDGGRWEHVGGLLLLGNPRGNQRVGGSLFVRNVTSDNSHHLSLDNGLTYSGELIGLHSPSRVIVEGCQFNDFGYNGRHNSEYGDAVTFAPQGKYAPLVLDMNVGTGQPADLRKWPIVHWNANGVNNIDGTEPFDPFESESSGGFRSLRGRWRLVTDGMTKTVAP